MWTFQRLALVGMSLFFVLSGFIIHYNYAHRVYVFNFSDLYDFFLARFSRLYPLFISLVIFDIFVSNFFIVSDAIDRSSYIRLFLYYFTGTHSWFYGDINNHPISFAYKFSVISWSISTEFFLYLCFPFISYFLYRFQSISFILFSVIQFIIAVFIVYIFRSNYAVVNNMAELLLGIRSEIKSIPPLLFSDWLTYISPYGRLPEFITGCTAAQLYLILRKYPTTAIENIFSIIFMTISLFYILFNLSPTASEYLPFRQTMYWMGFFPVMPIIIFCCARYSNVISQFFQKRFS